MKNVSFYKSKNGNSIMNTENFTKEIVRYLNSESLYIFKIISNIKYSVLVEFGCDEVRLHNICLIKGGGIKYIGVDIRAELKQKVEKYLVKHKNIKSKFIISSIEDFCNNAKEENSVFAIFPFNLIGNLNNIKFLLEKCYNNKYDIIISQFNTTLYAKKAREIYYKKCFKSNLIFCDDKNCHIFKTKMFESISYKKEYIIELCNKIGFSNIDSLETELFSIQYFRSI